MVGVTSAKLTGSDVSSVGFAVPSNDAVKFLNEVGIPILIKPESEALSGPELAKRVTPAVAQIRVRSAGGNFVALRYKAMYARSIHSKSDNKQISESEQILDERLLIIDEFGSILDISGEKSLPYMLGPLGAVAAETLDPTGHQKWLTEVAFPVMHVEGEAQDPLGLRTRSRFGRFGSALTQPKIKAYPAIRAESHEMTTLTEVELAVTKLTKVLSMEKEEDPFLNIDGTSEIRFSRKFGEMLMSRSKYMMIKNDAGDQTKIPVQCDISQLNGPLYKCSAQIARAGKDLHKQKCPVLAEINKLPRGYVL